MSLISRIEITNYLTEGVSESRRIMDWRPMLNGITLRMDSQSALVNVTNGGGKTSLADLVLYLLGRDDALLKRIRNKCSPSKKGYTHARIEFRDSSTDEYVEPSLLQIDPANLAGETHAEQAAQQRQLARDRLLAMAADHRAANDIRTLVAALKRKPELAAQDFDSAFEAWCSFALAQAQRIDPVTAASPEYFKTVPVAA